MKNLLKVSIISGAVFGIGASVLEFFLHYSLINPPNNKLAGVVLGILSGVCFGLVAHILFHSNNTAFLKPVSKALILPATGLLLGVIAVVGLSKLPHGQWKQTLPPPEKPILVLGYSRVIYIESKNGIAFSYTCDLYNSDQCKWDKEEALPDDPQNDIWSCDNGRITEYLLTPIFLFRKIIDSYEYSRCDRITIPTQSNLVLLNDGTIWVLDSIYPSFAYEIIAPIWLVVSTLAGFISYLVLLNQIKEDTIET